MEFVEKFPISNLFPADYNPRKIDAESFEALKESIQKFGIIKPVLVNGGNNILIAGHQRIKAMISLGITETPAILTKAIPLTDEARLNLFHNSLETNKSSVRIAGGLIPGSYQSIEHRAIVTEDRQNATYIGEMLKLMAKYGPWGTIVANDQGKVILNSDYAAASQILRQPMLAYIVTATEGEDIRKYLNREYGQYNYEALNVKNGSQTYCQMHRLRKGAKAENRSTLYEHLVLPQLKKEEKSLDFGAGQCDYQKALSESGYDILAYEPFLRYENRNEFWIDQIELMIRRIEKSVRESGLFDTVILDSVINSVTSLEYEHFVLLTCNALIKKDGRLLMATRHFIDNTRFKKTVSRKRLIEFLDKDGFSTIFRAGVWTKQRFHTAGTLDATLRRYFSDVHVSRPPDRPNQLVATCKGPLPFPEAEFVRALEAEFNPDYSGFRHEKHALLARQIMLKLESENRFS